MRLETPNDSLKAKSAEDRLLTASMLVSRCKTPPEGTQVKTEPIDAVQSKLILEAILTGDWTQRDALTQVTPQTVFQRLNLTANDGWRPAPMKDFVKDFNEYLSVQNETSRKANERAALGYFLAALTALFSMWLTWRGDRCPATKEGVDTAVEELS